ncbi:MAG: lamin tail domain-containing protein [Nitrososphaerales archaeon]
MTKLHLIFSILLISILIGVPFMHAYSQVALLKINEIELNPAGAIAGNQWIELYNPSNTLLDLSGFLIKSTKLGRTIPIPSGFVIEPNGYLVIPFQTRVFDEKGESIVLLTPDSVEITRTPILADEFDDDRTWQRFPNAIDTGNMTDWSFRNSTFGITNGFPVVRPNFTASEPIFVDQQGNKVGSFLQGQMAGIRTEIINKFTDERTFAYIIQVKNEEGFPVFIAWIEDIIIPPNRSLKPTVFFLAENRGEYTVDVFIWRSMTLTDPLTPPTHGLIRVAG